MFNFIRSSEAEVLCNINNESQISNVCDYNNICDMQ